MNKKFITETLRLMPDYLAVNGYLFQRSTEHIICGFACDKNPQGMYLWRYALPLYERFHFLHFGYGKRLAYPDGFMDVGRGNEKALSAEFVRRIQPYRSAVESLADPSNFAAYIETEIGLTNYIVRKGYAATLVMLGRRDDALSQLDILKNMDSAKRDQKRMADIDMLFDNLMIGTDKARSILGEWERETKQLLGLTSR